MICGACGTNGEWVFCSECGIKLPNEEIDYRYAYPIGPGLKVTVDTSEVEYDAKEVARISKETTQRMVKNIRRTAELSVAMFKATGHTFDAIQEQRKVSARKANAAANALQALSWGG